MAVCMENGAVVREDNIQVFGNNCTIYGDNATVLGNYNKIYGNNATVPGSRNKIYGNKSTVSGNYNEIFGSNNTVSGHYNTIKLVRPADEKQLWGPLVSETVHLSRNLDASTMAFLARGHIFAGAMGFLGGGTVSPGNGAMGFQGGGLTWGSQPFSGEPHRENEDAQPFCGEPHWRKNGDAHSDLRRERPVGESNRSKLENAADKKVPEDAPDDKICIVCMEMERRVLLSGCSHMALCVGCTLKILDKPEQERRCPFCRKEFVEDDALLIYLP